MIDLHLHTVFSDGKITNIEKIIQNCDVFSITDHNSVQACKYFKYNVYDKKMIVGCEVTVDRAPDYLLYFPKIISLDVLEEEFKSIRIAEENVIKKCYENMGYHQWDKDIAVAFPKNQKMKNARTRELAAIIHLRNTGLKYDNGNFDFDDLKIARKQRWDYAESIGNPISENIAFDIAKKYDGKLVLAHPIHTAIKHCSRDNTNFRSISEQLEILINSFIEKGGKYLEWEYFSVGHINRYDLKISELEDIRHIVSILTNQNGLEYTIGTDSHTLDDYDSAMKWLKKNEIIIKNRLANWIVA